VGRGPNQTRGAAPVGAGIGSGPGGATGFLAGGVIDDIEDSFDDESSLDGGPLATRTETGTRSERASVFP